MKSGIRLKQYANLCGAVFCLFILISSVVGVVAFGQKQTTKDSNNSPAIVSGGNVSITSTGSTPSSSTAPPTSKPASPPPPSPPSPPAHHLLTPEQVELWLETINAENRMWAEYLQATRTREAVLQQIRQELKCPGCVMSKQPAPSAPNALRDKVGRAVYMLVPAQ